MRPWHSIDLLSDDDFFMVHKILGKARNPDIMIAPEGKPYLYRWYLVPRNTVGANIYLHLQVADDSKRGLHDHPWDNQSVILAGGYREIMSTPSSPYETWSSDRRPGDVIHRRAESPHRLELLPGVPYSISLFTTGPIKREWGFWFEEGWVSHKEVCETIDGGTRRA
jgi:hypothetical protein